MAKSIFTEAVSTGSNFLKLGTGKLKVYNQITKMRGNAFNARQLSKQTIKTDTYNVNTSIKEFGWKKQLNEKLAELAKLEEEA